MAHYKKILAFAALFAAQGTCFGGEGDGTGERDLLCQVFNICPDDFGGGPDQGSGPELPPPGDGGAESPPETDQNPEIPPPSGG